MKKKKKKRVVVRLGHANALEEFASLILPPPSLLTAASTQATATSSIPSATEFLFFTRLHSHRNSRIEDLVHTNVLLGRTLHVASAHPVGNHLTLSWCDRRQSLGFEEIDAGFLVAEVGFQTAEDDGCCGAEVEDFGVPLLHILA
jgi:hypothetical protein